MVRKAYINKNHATESELYDVSRELKKYVEFHEKLMFIQDLYNGETVKYAISKRGKTEQTGRNWLKRWNESGFDGLFRKKGSGRKAELTEKDLSDLRKQIKEKELKDLKSIKHEIKKEFDVEYSDRHIRRILKKLNFGYGKPYTIYNETPENAEEILKERLENVNLDSTIVLVGDQSSIQSKDNTGREYYPKEEKNIKKKLQKNIK